MADVCGSCRAVLGDVPPAGGTAVDGEAFLPGRGEDSAGRWVLRNGFPAAPAWDALEAVGAPGFWGTAPESPRRVVRALPGLPPAFGTAGPPGWGVRGEPAGVFGVDADAFPSMVTLVWAEVWLVPFTVLPPAEWVDRVDWECVPVPAAPG